MMKRIDSTPYRSPRGFSIVEILMVFSLVVITGAIAVPIIGDTIDHLRLDSGLDFVTQQIRRARQAAVDDRRIYRLTIAGRNIVVERYDGAWNNVITLELPRGIEFGVPTGTVSGSPDGMGSTQAVNFQGANVVRFFPDGSARDPAGNYLSGVVYIRRMQEPAVGAAVTLFGATGRIKPWNLVEGQGGMKWR